MPEVRVVSVENVSMLVAMSLNYELLYVNLTLLTVQFKVLS